MNDQRFSVQFSGLHWSLSESTVRRLLRLGFLSGVELARREAPGEAWVRLHDTPLFAESVAHLGDPAVTAHRRRLYWWLPVGVPLTMWLALFAFILSVEPMPPDDLLAFASIVSGIPTLLLALWTSRFLPSLRALGGAKEPAAVEPQPEVVTPAEPDREQLRAELEVVQRLASSSRDPDRLAALRREEQALLSRMLRN